MTDLSQVPASELLEEALKRPDELLDDNGMLEDAPFRLADQLSTRVCVDGLPVRRNPDGDVEAMAIRRNTGPYAGRLCLIGGGVNRVKVGDIWQPESFEEALRRHFGTDLGFEIEPVGGSWKRPDYLAQEMRPIDGKVRDEFMTNPASRHIIAVRFLVSLASEDELPTFGETEYGGQEATGIEWFTEQTMPESSEFGYDHDDTYRTLFPVADSMLA